MKEKEENRCVECDRVIPDDWEMCKRCEKQHNKDKEEE